MFTLNYNFNNFLEDNLKYAPYINKCDDARLDISGRGFWCSGHYLM